MKRKISALLIALAMAAPSLSGCSIIKNIINKSHDDTSSEVTSIVDGSEDLSSDNSEDTSSEEGWDDPDTEIEIIDNDPVTEYKAETIEKLRTFLNKISNDTWGDSDVEDRIIRYALELGIGDELLVAAIEVVEESTFTGSNVAGIVDADIMESEEAYKEYAYKFLSVLASVDASKIGHLFEYINEEHANSIQTIIDETTLASMFPTGEYLIRLSSYLNLYEPDSLNVFKTLAEGGAGDEFQEAYNELYYLDTASIAYTEKQIKQYENTIAELNEVKNRKVIPSLVIDFFNTRGEESVKELINDLKIIVDNYYPLFKDAIELTEKYYSGSKSNRHNKYFSADVYSHYSEEFNYDGYVSASMVYEESGEQPSSDTPTHHIFELLANNFENVKNIYEGLLVREEGAKLVVNVIKELVLPLIFQSMQNSDPNVLQVRAEITRKLNNIDATDFRALTKFLIDVISRADLKDFDDLTDGVGFEEFELVDKCAPMIREEVNKLSSSEKNSINEIASILGIDFFDFLENIMKIIEERGDMSSEEQRSTFIDKLTSYENGIYNDIYNNFLIAFSGSAVEDQPSTVAPSEEDLYVYASSSISVVQQGSTIGYDSFYCNVREYDEYGNSQMNYYPLNQAVENGLVTISNWRFDTSKIGYTELSFIAQTATGYQYNYSSTILVIPTDFTIYQNIPLSGEQCRTTSSVLYVALKGSTVSYNDGENDVNVPTDEAGYHLIKYGNAMSIIYVVDDDELKYEATRGLGLLGASKLYSNPTLRSFIDLPILNEKFYWDSQSINVEGSLFDNSEGRHSINYMGHTIVYDIYNPLDADYTYYYYHLDDLFKDIFENNSIKSYYSVRGYEQYNFNGNTSNTSAYISSEELNKTITQVSYDGSSSLLRFTLEGASFTLSIKVGRY